MLFTFGGLLFYIFRGSFDVIFGLIGTLSGLLRCAAGCKLCAILADVIASSNFVDIATS